MRRQDMEQEAWDDRNSESDGIWRETAVVPSPDTPIQVQRPRPPEDEGREKRRQKGTKWQWRLDALINRDTLNDLNVDNKI